MYDLDRTTVSELMATARVRAAPALRLALLLGHALLSPSQVLRAPPNWQLNRSTIIMPCNSTGFLDPASTAGWSVVDFDWSNAKGTGSSEGWAKARPMNCEESMQEQVTLTSAHVSPPQL